MSGQSSSLLISAPSTYSLNDARTKRGYSLKGFFNVDLLTLQLQNLDTMMIGLLFKICIELPIQTINNILGDLLLVKTYGP